jgi:flagellar biosynthetic protein FliR
MFEVYNLSQTEIIGFAMVLIRISAFIVTMPIVGTESVPRHLKVLFALSIALLIYPSLALQKANLGVVEAAFIWVALKEALIGVILGYISRLFFFALTISGEIISLSIGLSSEQVFNPTMGGRTTAIQQFQIFIGTLFFLSINGHYYLISGITQSFDILPLSVKGFEILSAQDLALMCREIIWVGIKMSAPVMASLFFMNTVMAILGRAVPQINVLITSLPVNVLVGFFIVMISIPLLLVNMEEVSQMTAAKLFQVMKGM